MIGLVDCESFYASCETAFRPDLAGSPVVVLTNNDHWIIALNREAKKLGLARGQRLGDILPLINKESIRLFSSNYAFYDDMSKRVMETLKEFSRKVEIYSIDEAFVDFSGILDLRGYASEIRETIRRQTFIPTSIGIGATRSLAKVAQRLAKKRDGILVLDTPCDVENALRQTRVEDIWGIGYALSRQLHDRNIHTAADFVSMPEWEVKKGMTTVGWKLQKELKGIPMTDLKVEANPRKQIIISRQFGRPVQDLTELCEAVSSYTEIAVQKLIRQKSTCRIVKVVLEAFRIRGQGMSSAALELEGSDFLPVFVTAAKQLLLGLYREGRRYWRATIVLYGIEPYAGAQMDLFSAPDSRKKNLLGVVERINRKYGKRTLHPAASSITSHWEMRRDYLSPYFTTRLSDFPVISTGD